uniref:Uncharacterized protein n=1 Tax=Plectus sambesii TaxID=2011161 RepID=A0A914URP5_9BILA
MLKDKISLTDWQATDQSLSEQIARESYLQFLREKEEQMKERNVPCHSGSLLKPKSPSRTKDPPSPAASSSVSGSSAVADVAPSCSSDIHRTDPDATATASASGGAPGETCSLMDGLPASAFGLTDWGDESDMLAQVLAMSQAEYLETLKANKSKDDQQPGSSSS